MNRFCFVIVILIINFINTQANESLSIIYPDGGEIINSNAQFLITWESSTFINNIDIFLWNGTSKQFIPIVSNISSTITQYGWLPTPNAIGENCRIKIITNDSLNTVDFSDTYFTINNLQQSTKKTNSVTENNFGKYINIYPNPAEEILTISWKSNVQLYEIEIYDLYGKKVFQTSEFENIHQEQIDVSNLPKGIYFVNVKINNGFIVVKKIIVL